MKAWSMSEWTQAYVVILRSWNESVNPHYALKTEMP